MAGEVVVERDRDGKALTAPTRPHRVLQVGCGHDPVMLDQEPNLRLEEPGLVGWHELSPGIAEAVIHTVVHDRDPRLAASEPEHQHRGDAQRHAHET